MVQHFFILTAFFLFVLPALSKPKPFRPLLSSLDPAASVATPKLSANTKISRTTISAENTEAFPRKETLEPLAVADTSQRAVSSLTKREIVPASLGDSPHKPAAAAPSALGSSLGSVGLETPEFKTQCKNCCRSTRSAHRTTLALLNSCSNCWLKDDAPFTNDCPKGTWLGFAGGPTNCFYTRCYSMLSSASCLCLR